MSKMIKTTKIQFELFKIECERYCKEFKLDDWERNYWHQNPTIGNGECSMGTNITFRRSDIYFGIDRINEEVLNDQYVKECAKHEIIHLLLSDVVELGNKRFLNKEEMMKAEESLVRKLEKIINY